MKPTINEIGLEIVERSQVAPKGWRVGLIGFEPTDYVARSQGIEVTQPQVASNALSWFVPDDAMLGDKVRVLVGSDWRSAKMTVGTIIGFGAESQSSVRFAVAIQRLAPWEPTTR